MESNTTCQWKESMLLSFFKGCIAVAHISPNRFAKDRRPTRRCLETGSRRKTGRGVLSRNRSVREATPGHRTFSVEIGTNILSNSCLVAQYCADHTFKAELLRMVLHTHAWRQP
ncbi:hypothetical protein B0H10DRAFT_2003163 [Mycena sp. CBHHK59/15]|nr:hypothetical protein B0H10DRAFT_2003163 [Mycena sp. CBHHK59/15]